MLELQGGPGRKSPTDGPRSVRRPSRLLYRAAEITKLTSTYRMWITVLSLAIPPGRSSY